VQATQAEIYFLLGVGRATKGSYCDLIKKGPKKWIATPIAIGIALEKRFELF
jgi:hypothetical protein